ncbi:MAG: hypothetical protein F6K41_08335 [Symploca sp. SIO3E6]|nr:hypothetical protein [Caldora sp. SIO3E6]
MLNKWVSHAILQFQAFAIQKSPRKLHLLAQKPGIDPENPWVTLEDANAQN